MKKLPIIVVIALVIVVFLTYTIATPKISLGQGVRQSDGSYGFDLPEINTYNYTVDWGDGYKEEMDTKCPPMELCGLRPFIAHKYPETNELRTYKVVVIAIGTFGIKKSVSVDVLVMP